MLVGNFSLQLENLELLGSEDLAGSGNGLANTLTGNAGNNALDGGAGDDTLYGGDGNDTLDGGTGSDTLFGGLGDDLFLFSDGVDIIGDFTAGVGSDDVIDLAEVTTLNSFEGVQAAARQVGADVQIDAGGGDSINLIGINLADLHQDDFLV